MPDFRHRRHSTDMRRIPPIHALLLAALLLLAQLQGVMHGISHLSDQGGVHDVAATHALVCPDCAAFAQAGAAPVPVMSAALLDPPADIVIVASALLCGAATTPACYQSRAPPSAHA